MARRSGKRGRPVIKTSRRSASCAVRGTAEFGTKSALFGRFDGPFFGFAAVTAWSFAREPGHSWYHFGCDGDDPGDALCDGGVHVAACHSKIPGGAPDRWLAGGQARGGGGNRCGHGRFDSKRRGSGSGHL